MASKITLSHSLCDIKSYFNFYFRAFAVDHQVFALTKLDVTGNGSDDIVVCSWDGQTYILDQEKNSARFHLNEAVQAFESGYYGAREQEPDVKSFIYITFKNTVSMEIYKL